MSMNTPVEHLIHDLKSPLQALKVLADTEGPFLTKAGRSALVSIAHYLEGTLQIGFGSQALPVHLPTEMERLWSWLELKKEEHGLDLDVEVLLDRDLESRPVWMGSVELVGLRRITVNLIENAMAALSRNASSVSRGHIQVQIQRFGGDGLFVLTVKDNGGGVDREGKASTRLSHGVGLSSVRNLVDQLGGRFLIENKFNELGFGVCATCWLQLESHLANVSGALPFSRPR